MNHGFKAATVCLAGFLLGSTVYAEDRLTLTANGSTLTGTDGGWGGAIGWLHHFNSKAVLGAGVQYQTIADSQWQFGSLNGALSGGTGDRKWSLYAEAHKGTGDDDTHDFTYQIAAVGAVLPLVSKLSLQLEDRQIDVDTTHGNMPKLGLSYVWTPGFQTTAAYTRSVSGNLSTNLKMLRMDYYARGSHLILGAAVGDADPVVVNLQPGVNLPSSSLREGYIGFSRLFSRTEFLILADYLELGDSERVTLTLSYSLYLNRPKQAR